MSAFVRGRHGNRASTRVKADWSFGQALSFVPDDSQTATSLLNLVLDMFRVSRSGEGETTTRPLSRTTPEAVGEAWLRQRGRKSRSEVMGDVGG